MIEILHQLSQPTFFVTNLVIFVSSLYIAIYNKTMPNWVITPLWYTGLSSLFMNITIVLEWVFGDTYCMSFAKIGYLGELAFAISVAVTLTFLFIQTLKQTNRQV